MAHALPMPEPAPVTNATFTFSTPSMRPQIRLPLFLQRKARHRHRCAIRANEIPNLQHRVREGTTESAAACRSARAWGLARRLPASTCAAHSGDLDAPCAASAALVWPLPDDLGDDALGARLYPPPAPVAADRPPQPELARLHYELKRLGATLQLLSEEHRAQFPDGYSRSRFCELYRVWAARLSPVMRQMHVAGEKLFVDNAGTTIDIVDASNGKVHACQLFVANEAHRASPGRKRHGHGLCPTSGLLNERGRAISAPAAVSRSRRSSDLHVEFREALSVSLPIGWRIGVAIAFDLMRIRWHVPEPRRGPSRSTKSSGFSVTR